MLRLYIHMYKWQVDLYAITYNESLQLYLNLIKYFKFIVVEKIQVNSLTEDLDSQRKTICIIVHPRLGTLPSFYYSFQTWASIMLISIAILQI